MVLITLSAKCLLSLHDYEKTRERKTEGEKRGTVEERSEAVNCLSIQGEGRGRKEEEGEERGGRRK